MDRMNDARTAGGRNRRGRKRSVTLRPEVELNADQLAFRRAWKAHWEENTLAMSRDLKVSEAAIRQWVNGTRTPRLDFVQRLATALHTNVDALRQPLGIFFKGKSRLEDHPLYERLVAALLAVDPTLKD
jgi:transcriptional regulator with XRE-family HTH domain